MSAGLSSADTAAGDGGAGSSAGLFSADTAAVDGGAGSSAGLFSADTAAVDGGGGLSAGRSVRVRAPARGTKRSIPETVVPGACGLAGQGFNAPRPLVPGDARSKRVKRVKICKRGDLTCYSLSHCQCDDFADGQ